MEEVGNVHPVVNISCYFHCDSCCPRWLKTFSCCCPIFVKTKPLEAPEDLSINHIEVIEETDQIKNVREKVLKKE